MQNIIVTNTIYESIVVGAGLAGATCIIKIGDLLLDSSKSSNVADTNDITKHADSLSGTIKSGQALCIEAGKKAVPDTCSSVAECYKLHLGLHYIGDLATAEQCLRKSIEFARTYKDFIASDDLNAPCRRGCHYIMENSMVSKEEALAIADHLRKTYSQLILEDPANKVFGEPENFIVELVPEQYKHIADSIPCYDQDHAKHQTKVILGFETAESQIDIHKMREHLTAKITSHPNISFLPNNKVTHITPAEDFLGYKITTEDTEGKQHHFYTKTVVNCSWQNIEKLTKTSGVNISDDLRVNRVKASIVVTLPPELHDLKTCIFSSGPYTSITVMPNGQAILTSERITNVGFYNANEDNIPPELEKLISELNLDCAEGQNKAQQILEDCAANFKGEQREAFLRAKIEKMHVGFVKIMAPKEPYTKNTIYQDDAKVIQARQEEGIERHGLGHVSNAGMKMTYTESNSVLIRMIVAVDLMKIKIIELIVSAIQERMNLTQSKIKYSPSLREKLLQLCEGLVEIKMEKEITEKMNKPGKLTDPDSHASPQIAEHRTKPMQRIKINGDKLTEGDIAHIQNAITQKIDDLVDQIDLFKPSQNNKLSFFSTENKKPDDFMNQNNTPSPPVA